MLIKVNNLEFQIGQNKVVHSLGKKLPDGRYEVKHPTNCECQMLHTVQHARWITYNQIEGVIQCDHCEKAEFLPCPAVRDKIHSRKVWMDVQAIARDLWNFQIKHENCPPPAGEKNPDGTKARGGCSHLRYAPDGSPEQLP